MPLLTAKSWKWLFLPDRVSEDYIAEFFDFRTLSSSMQASVVHSSLYLMDPEHKVRVRAVQIVNHPIFTNFILFAILSNSVLLALDDPKASELSWDEKSDLDRALYVMDILYGIIFIVEAVIKIIALGFMLHRFSYLRDFWNCLDFAIVCSFPLTVAGTGGGGLTALRVARVFRPLRSIARVESLRAILNKLISSLPRLSDVFALMMFITWFSAVMGINLFAGIHDMRCYYDARDYDTKWADIRTDAGKAIGPQWRLVENMSHFICDDSEDSCSNFAKLNLLPYNRTPSMSCHADPNTDTFSILSFTNIGTALVLALKLISRDNWSTQISAISSGLGIGSFLYFFVVTFFGGYFCLNLFIAVLTSAFQNSDDVEAARKEFPYRMRFAHSLGGSAISDAALCLTHQSTRYDQEKIKSIQAQQRRDAAAASSAEAVSGGDGGDGGDDGADGGGGGDGGGGAPQQQQKGFFQSLEEGMASPLDVSRRGRRRRGSSSSDDEDDDGDEFGGLDEVEKARLRMQRRRSFLANSMALSQRVTDDAGDGNDPHAAPGPRPTGASFDLDNSTSQLSPGRNDANNNNNNNNSQVAVVGVNDGGNNNSDLASDTSSSLHRRRKWYSYASIKKFFKKTGWQPLHDLVVTIHYTIFVMLITLVFAIALSLDSVDVDPTLADNVNIISLACNIFFLVDVLIKIVGLGPSFFPNAMNMLDLGLAAASVPDLINANTNALSALRAIRLLRLLRIAKQWRSLQRLMDLIIIALKSVASLSLVALIFIYIFAILGYQIFNADVGESRFSFATVFDSLLTVFVLVTGENWSDMTRDMWPSFGVGCVFYFVPIFIIGNFFIANLFIAIIIDSFSEVSADSDEEEEEEERDDLDGGGDDDGDGYHRGGGARRSASRTEDGDDDEEEGQEMVEAEGDVVEQDVRGAYLGASKDLMDAIESNRQMLIPCEDSSDEDDMDRMMDAYGASNNNNNNNNHHGGRGRKGGGEDDGERQSLLPNHDTFHPRPQSEFHRKPLGASGFEETDLTPAAAAANAVAFYTNYKRRLRSGSAVGGDVDVDGGGAGDENAPPPLEEGVGGAQQQQQQQQYRAKSGFNGAKTRDEAASVALAHRIGLAASFDENINGGLQKQRATANIIKSFVQDRGVTPESLSLVGDCRLLTRAAAREMQHVERIRHEEQRLAQHAVAFVTLSRVKKQTEDMAAAANNKFGKLRDDKKQENFKTVAEQRSLEERYEGARYRSLFYFEPTHKRRVMLVKLTKSSAFNYIILGLILISTMLLVLDTPQITREAPAFQVAISVTDYVIAVAFTIEVAIKLVAFGGFMHRGSYFRSVWNCLDFFASVLSLVALGVPSVKALRVLRFARVMSLTFHMRIVITSLLQALPGMTSVVVFMLFVWWVFAIVGVASFKGRYGICNDPALSRGACNGTMVSSQTLMDGTVIKEVVPLEWTSQLPSSHFDDVPSAFYTLLKLSLGDGWFDIMYVALDSPGEGEAPVRNSNPFAALYFVIFMIVGNFFILNLFVGVLADRFVALRQRGSGYHLLSEAQKQWVLAQRVLFRTEVPITPPCPQNAFRRWCYYEVQTTRFDYFFTAIIMLQSVQLSMYVATTDTADTYTTVLDAVGLIMLCLFTIEIIMKMLALNPILFWRTMWNRFDLVIVALSWLGVFIGNQVNLIRVFRVFRLFLLLRKLKGIQTLFVALYQAIPELINVGVVLTVVYMIFAVIGVALFSNIPISVDPLSSLVNFQNVGAALIALYISMTTDGWDAIADAVGVQEPDCNAAAGECGTRWVAYLYFILYMFIMSMILVNLLVTVVLGNFNDAQIAEEQETLFQVIQDFRDRWAENDPDGTQRLDAAVVLRLLPTLPSSIWDHAPLKVRGRSLPMWIHFLRQLQRFHIPMGRDHTCKYQDVIASLALRLFCVNVQDAIRSSRTTTEGVVWDENLFSIHHHYAALKLSRVARRFIRARGERMAMRQLREIKEQHTILIENEYIPLRRSHEEAVALARFALQRASAAESQSMQLRKQLDSVQQQQQRHPQSNTDAAVGGTRKDVEADKKNNSSTNNNANSRIF